MLLNDMSQNNESSSSNEEPSTSPLERKRKVLTCVLLGITILLLGSNMVLPHINSYILEITTGRKFVNVQPLLFQANYIGNIFGFITGGVCFDYFEPPKEKEKLFSIMLIVLALATSSVPLCSNPFGLGVNIFFHSLCVSFCMAGIITYAFGLLGLNSNTCMQFLYFLRCFGTYSTVGISVLIKDHFENVATSGNSTSNDRLRSDAITMLVTSHVFSAFLLVLLVAAWFCFRHFSPPEFMLKMPFDDSRNMGKGQGFFIFAVISTVPLIFIANFVEALYPSMIMNFATHIVSEKVQQKKTLPVYWGCLNIGRLCATILAYRCCTSTQFIVISCGLQLCAGCLLALASKEEEIVLWISTSLLGLAGSSLLPSTYVWLNSHIHVNSKIAALMGIISVLTTSLSTLVIKKTFQKDSKNSIYYIILSPTFYAIIFAIQAIVFYQVKHSSSRRGRRTPRAGSLALAVISRINLSLNKQNEEDRDPEPCREVMTDDIQTTMKSSAKSEFLKTYNVLRSLENQTESVVTASHSKPLRERRRSDDE